MYTHMYDVSEQYLDNLGITFPTGLLMALLSPQTIEDELAKAEHFWKEGAAFSALARLGVLLGAEAALKVAERVVLETRVGELLQDIDAAAAASMLEQKVHRLSRILSDADRLHFEEVLFALTWRIEIAAVMLCFRTANRSVDTIVGLTGVDRSLRELAASSSQGRFTAAVTSVEKNWRSRLPFSFAALGLADLLGQDQN